MHHLRDLLFDLQNKEDFKQFKRETLVFVSMAMLPSFVFGLKKEIFLILKSGKTK